MGWDISPHPLSFDRHYNGKMCMEKVKIVYLNAVSGGHRELTNFKS